MARTYIVDRIQVTGWSVDVVQQCVVVKYNELLTDGQPFREGTATFWVTIPSLTDEGGSPLPTPPDWYQLPAQYASTLRDLTADVAQALTERLLG